MTALTKAERGFALLDGAAEMGRTGLVIARDLSFDEWSELGAGLQVIDSGIQWVLGDWLNYGEQRYGEKYSQAVEMTGYAYQSLANIAYVASRIEISRRRENLRFSHHEVVAALEPAEQEALLSKAVEYSLTVAALRDAVKTFRKELKAPAPMREAPMKIAEPKPPTESEYDFVAELERADKQLRETEQLVESLTKDDKDRELRSLHAQLAQTNARINSLLKEKHAAVEQAQYAEKILKKVREALGVQRDKDILPALQQRAAA